LKKILKTLL